MELENKPIYNYKDFKYMCTNKYFEYYIQELCFSQYILSKKQKSSISLEDLPLEILFLISKNASPMNKIYYYAPTCNDFGQKYLLNTMDVYSSKSKCIVNAVASSLYCPLIKVNGFRIDHKTIASIRNGDKDLISSIKEIRKNNCFTYSSNFNVNKEDVIVCEIPNIYIINPEEREMVFENVIMNILEISD